MSWSAVITGAAAIGVGALSSRGASDAAAAQGRRKLANYRKRESPTATPASRQVSIGDLLEELIEKHV